MAPVPRATTRRREIFSPLVAEIGFRRLQGGPVSTHFWTSRLECSGPTPDTFVTSGTAFAGSFVQMGDGDDRMNILPGAGHRAGMLGRGHFVKVNLGAGDDYFGGPAGKHCWIVYGGRGDDVIEWTGTSHRHHRGWWC